MSRKYLIISMLLCVFLLAGCGLIGGQTATTQAATAQVIVVTATPEPEQKVIVVTATPEAAEPTTQYIIITATPETAAATATTAAAATTTVPTIVMANTYMQDARNMYISWNADGNMENGFQVLWSAVNSAPSFPVDSSTYVSDLNNRIATIQVEPGKTYYVRVCRYNGSACDLYSNTITVKAGTGSSTTTYIQPTYPYINYRTPEPSWSNQPSDWPLYIKPTKTATSTGSSGATGTAYIHITSVYSSVSGAAVVHWSASGSFPYGFLVLYSSVPATPTYGDYSYVEASSSSARSATVSGSVGTTYYYRVCRFTGTTCDSYSNVYSFKY